MLPETVTSDAEALGPSHLLGGKCGKEEGIVNS